LIDLAEKRVFHVTVSVDEDGRYVSECLDLPGCVSQGKTEKEALENIRDAIRGYLASLKKHGESIPAPRERHYVEVAVSV
jgi:predicted RNase H-like HicB family nuclease